MSLTVKLVAVAVLWAGSIYVTYDLTRTKWHSLGRTTGEISGQAMVLKSLCEASSPGEPTTEVIWSYSIKAEQVELTPDGLFCR
ncbi:hypothetical protein [Roseibium sp.]|uniref:hypothetical protein n=1 Tax=Roseibium sp. TaxID=1936156 RepID=UPI003B50CAF1